MQYSLVKFFFFALFRLMHSLALFWYSYFIFLFICRSLFICNHYHSLFADLCFELIFCFSVCSVLFLRCIFLYLSFLFRSSSITLAQKTKKLVADCFTLFVPNRSTRPSYRSLFLLISLRVLTEAILLLTSLASQNQVLRLHLSKNSYCLPHSM